MPIAYKLRENDIIASRDELKQSILNNLSIFFPMLLDKLIYEVSLAHSVTSKAGETFTAPTKQVQVGTMKSGAPKYKMVASKFAVIDIYIMLPNAPRQKIVRLVLAPINKLEYNPLPEDLRVLAGNIKDTVQMALQPPAEAPKPAPIITPPTPTPAPAPIITPPTPTPAPAPIIAPPAPAPAPAPIIAPPAPAPAPAPIIAPAPAPTPAKPGANATTLYEWYTANNQPLPTISARAILYQNFGLGSAAFYVGTAEQNTALLAKLKAK